MAGTNYNAVYNDKVKISLTDENNFAITCECNGDPNTFAIDAGRFANGCILRRTDVGTGNVLYQNTGTLSIPSWTLFGGGSFSLPITTVLASGTATYDQTNNFLGLGLTGTGQIWDTGSGGINMLASIDTTPFGGQPDTTITGYLSVGGPVAANTQYSYDVGADESTIRLSSGNLTGKQARINLRTNPTDSIIQFSFSGGGNYTFPTTTAAAGQVLTDVLGNGTLSWQTPTPGSGIAIGDAIGGATVGSVLFIDGSGNLAEDANQFVYTAGGDFAVRHNGLDYLRVNYSTSDYGIGDIQAAGNKTNLRVSDSASSIYAYASAGFFVNEPTTGYVAFKADPNARVTVIGDANSSFNKTRISVDDVGGDINISTSGNGSIIQMGDTGSFGFDTLIHVNDFAKQVFVQTEGTFAVQTLAGKRVFETSVSGGNLTAQIGDINAFGNSTYILIDDNTQLVKITNVPAYADDTAATGAGLTTGNLYKTTTGGSTFLKIVP